MNADPGTVFVGRAAELEQLRNSLGEVRAGRGRLFMLTGEAGIGKTRLADELAAEAGAHGARVLWGRCWESGGAPAYWPWVQALRTYVAAIDSDALSAELGHGAADVAQILPEVRARLTLPETALPMAPEQARFQLFDSLTSFLRAAAARQPLVLILEDLHTADQPSLLLMQFVARELRSLPLLIVGSARPVDRGRDRPVADILAAIMREGREIRLPALTREDVADYLTNLATSPPAPETVDAVYNATEGNPLFVTEVLRLLQDGRREALEGADRELRLPVVLRAAIRQHAAPLPESTRAVLDIAAVIGRQFDVSVLERVWRRQADEPGQREALMDALEDAVKAGVIRRAPGTIGDYLFVHALIRDTLADDLPWATRSSLHRRIGEALEEVWAANLAQHLSEMAQHFVAAAADGDVDKALEYTRRAGDRAMALLAFEEAAQHYQRAVEVLGLRAGGPRPADELIRCDLLLSLGDAVWGAGDMAKMREYMQLAAESARTLEPVVGRKEAAARTARAALGYGGRYQRAHGVYEEDVIRLLEEARVALGDEDSPLRARVLARLAYAIYLQPDSLERRDALSREAVAVARRCGDPLALRLVLNDRRWAVWHTDTVGERRQIAAELVVLAEQTGDRELALGEHAWRMIDFLEQGDIAGVDAEFGAYVRLATENPGPSYDWFVVRFTAMRHTLEGRFEEAERQARLGFESPRRSPPQDAILDHSAQLLDIRIHQGRLDEALRAVRTLAAEYPSPGLLQYIVPYVHAEAGQLDEARLDLDRLDPTGRAELRRDWAQLPIGAFMAEACALVGDVDRAGSLYGQLLPYADRCAVISHGVSCRGAMARYLGLLAATTGDREAAAEHYRNALRINARIRSRPFLARTQFNYACLLLEGGDPAAGELFEAARATATEIGMHRLRERIEQIGAAARPATAGAGRDGGDAGTHGRFERTGDLWSIRYSGAVFQLKPLLGLTYIAHLLRHPGVELHVADLVDLVEDGEGADRAARSAADTPSGDGSETIDAEAKAEYRRRLADLREELEDAEALNDLGRAARVRDAIEVLGEQLAERFGIGGAPRPSTSHAERARIRVAKRIAVALRKVGEHDPILAGHLRASIKTGTLCAYEPDPTQRVTWEL